MCAHRFGSSAAEAASIETLPRARSRAETMPRGKRGICVCDRKEKDRGSRDRTVELCVRPRMWGKSNAEGVGPESSASSGEPASCGSSLYPHRPRC